MFSANQLKLKWESLSYIHLFELLQAFVLLLLNLKILICAFFVCFQIKYVFLAIYTKHNFHESFHVQDGL